ncbi:MAG TPA: class I SAM-dependent methyltransferase [Polyangiaceae bacterium]|nr:class I SAM-dependent methyltransferase [Polyangiaceae bacterium]
MSVVEWGKSYLRPLYGPLKRRMVGGLDLLGHLRREGSIVASAQRYWDEAGGSARGRSSAHFRDAEVFEGAAGSWLHLGKRHLEIYQTFERAVGSPMRLERVLEWGCGGGANAVHFAPLCREFLGVDVADEMLAECARQVAQVTSSKFTPIKVKIAEPEAVLSEVKGQIELFLCTYVFELIPSRAYGARLLRIAGQLLCPGGMALIQIKYPERSSWSSAKRWDYAKNHANATQYPIEEFWQEAESAGLLPRLVRLVPQDPVVHDLRYAYFCLIAPDRPGRD